MVQNLQPVGTVNWSDGVGDSFELSREINGDMDAPFIVNVLFGGDRIVYPKEGGEWVFLAELEQDEDYYYDRTDEFARETSDYFVVDIAGKDGRFLFTERDD